MTPAYRVVFTLAALTFGVVVPAARANHQATRALEAVERLRAEGAVPPGTVLHLLVKQGNVANFWGHDFELKNEWEEATGIPLDIQVMPQQPVLEELQKRDDIELTVARNREYPDLVEQGLIEDLTPYFEKYGFSLSEDPHTGYVLPDLQSRYRGHTVAVPADADVALLYLRRDLLEDPARRARFAREFGRPLAAPRTWDEYLELVTFFDDPDHGFYGCVEQRDPDTAWMTWLPRYLSQAEGTQPLFDTDMHPLIDSPAGLAATMNYLATVPHSPPGIVEKGSGYDFAVPVFKRGDSFAYVITLAGAKIFNAPTSKVRGRFAIYPMPGTRAGGRLVRRTTLIYGNNLVVPTRAYDKDLAFLFTMWFTDHDVSVRSVTERTGHADPYRFNHFDSPRVEAIYTRQALDGFLAELPHTTAAGTGLPGDTEYMGALSRNLWRAARGDLTADEALKQTAATWEATTERYGREAQKARWAAFRACFPRRTDPFTP